MPARRYVRERLWPSHLRGILSGHVVGGTPNSSASNSRSRHASVDRVSIPSHNQRECRGQLIETMAGSPTRRRRNFVDRRDLERQRGGRKRAGSMWNRRNFDWRVVGRRPRRAAAPEGPPTRPPLSESACSMADFSISSRRSGSAPPPPDRAGLLGNRSEATTRSL